MRILQRTVMKRNATLHLYTLSFRSPQPLMDLQHWCNNNKILFTSKSQERYKGSVVCTEEQFTLMTLLFSESETG